MNKSKLIAKLTIPLIILGVFLSSYAYIPVLRAAIGVDESITMNFSTMLVFLVGGYMAGLAGLISWFRTIAANPSLAENESNDYLRKPHLLGLTFLIPIPFISCLILGWFWRKDRHVSTTLENVYRETINFHLAIHLYLLVSFFLMPVVLGFLMVALLFLTLLISTLFNIAKAHHVAKYPINIKILTN